MSADGIKQTLRELAVVGLGRDQDDVINALTITMVNLCWVDQGGDMELTKRRVIDVVTHAVAALERSTSSRGSLN